jgi:hypothetical protein
MTTPYEAVRQHVVEQLALRDGGHVDANSIGRLPNFGAMAAGEETGSWPNGSARLSIVRGAGTVTLLTDGLSDPWSVQVFGPMNGDPLGYELALRVPRDPEATGPLGRRIEDAFLSGGWPATLLFALADWLVHERVDLRRGLQRFGCLTLACRPVPELEGLVAQNGFLGLLAGMPLIGSDIDAHVYVSAPGTEKIGFFPVKLLLREEYEWALSRGDTGARELGERFLRSDEPLLSSPTRPSILCGT